MNRVTTRLALPPLVALLCMLGPAAGPEHT
jgi:hypothetical protein